MSDGEKAVRFVDTEDGNEFDGFKPSGVEVGLASEHLDAKENVVVLVIIGAMGERIHFALDADTALDLGTELIRVAGNELADREAEIEDTIDSVIEQSKEATRDGD